jgi:hypothetical protein
MNEAAQIRRTPDPEQTRTHLRYIAEMSGELACIAGALKRPMLTYFLNMARVEAEMLQAELAPPGTTRAAIRR